jgi:voltage-gated potassium channel
MIESFSLLMRLLRAIVRAWRRDPQFRTLLGLVLFTLLSGTIFYSLQEGWSVVDAFYFSVTTLTTVGLGDLAPTTTVGKLFTVVNIFAGLSLVLLALLEKCKIEPGRLGQETPELESAA